MPEPILIDAMMAEVESTYGTDPTPVAGTDDVVLAEPIWANIDITHQWPNERDLVVVGGGGSLLPTTPTVPRGRICRLTFNIEPRVKGSAYTAALDLRGTSALLRMCGLSVTVNASGLDFTWISSSLESGTIWFYAGGNRYRLNGCMGRCEAVFPTGQQAMLRFEITGLLRLDPDAQAVPSITYLTNAAPSVVNAAMTVGAWSPDFENATLNFGQEVVVRPNGNATDGLRIRIARHRPRLMMVAESIALGTYDPYTDRKTPTARTIALTIGSGAGLQIKLVAVTGYVSDPRHPDLTGFTGWDLNYLVTAGTLRFD